MRSSSASNRTRVSLSNSFNFSTQCGHPLPDMRKTDRETIAATQTDAATHNISELDIILNSVKPSSWNGAMSGDIVSFRIPGEYNKGGE